MDYTNKTERFWKNVDTVKKNKHLTWKDIAEKSGHSAASISTMSNMNKMPSLGFAISIADAIGVPVEKLWKTTIEPASSKNVLDVVIMKDSMSQKTRRRKADLSPEKLQTAREVLTILLGTIDDDELKQLKNIK